jgi:hypothetical protein
MSGLSLAQQQLAATVISGSGNGITCIDDGNALHLMRESGEILISFQHSGVADSCSTSVKAAGGAAFSIVETMDCSSMSSAGGGAGGGGGGGASSACGGCAANFFGASSSSLLDDGSIRDNGGGGSKFPPSLSWVEDKWHMHCSSPFPAKDSIRRNSILGYIKCPGGETVQALHIVNAMSSLEKAAWQNENGFVSKSDKQSLALALRLFSDWKQVDHLNESARRANGRLRRNKLARAARLAQRSASQEMVHGS